MDVSLLFHDVMVQPFKYCLPVSGFNALLLLIFIVVLTFFSFAFMCLCLFVAALVCSLKDISRLHDFLYINLFMCNAVCDTGMKETL